MKNNKTYNSDFCKDCPYSESKHLIGSLKNEPIKPEIHNSDTLLVFQAPGKDEWSGNNGTTRRAPIISNNPHSAAARMRNSFARKNVRREDFDITEVVLCYPGKYESNNRDMKPKKTAIDNCIKNLENIISQGNYTTIISFGEVAKCAVKKALISTNNQNIIHKAVNHPCYRLKNEDLDALF